MQPRGEWLGVAFWAGLGTTVFVAGWRMDRLAHQGIAPWSAPGLLPAVVGALMVAFALVLAAQAWRDGSAAPLEPPGGDDIAQPPDDGGFWRGSAVAALLCVLFAGLSLGHGWPFPAEAALFIFAFTTLFSWRTWRAEGGVARRLAQTAAVAAGAALAISWLFESVFLVRLP